jgi:hypothetical protein
MRLQPQTNRTALDCIKHFKTISQALFRWTDILDNKLREAVEKYGSSNWVLGARTRFLPRVLRPLIIRSRSK